MSRDPAYLLDMLDSARLLQQYLVGKSKDEFLSDTGLQDMVVRRLEVIGEAARRISEEARGQTPQIPWRRMIGLRNLLIHQYDKIEAELIWEIAEVDVPLLVTALTPLVPPPGRAAPDGPRAGRS
jgi:uncharacterized protein with HEPN domain